MSTISKEVTYIGPDGLPTTLDIDADLWGSGTDADKPISGTQDKDMYVVFDNSTGEYRMEIWDSTAVAWKPLQGNPVGASGGGSHGDILYRGASSWEVLSSGTEGYILQTQGSGQAPSWVDHRALRQLIHFLEEGPGAGFASGAYKEILPAGDPFPTSEIWYTDSGKTNKILELTITRNANQTPATEVYKMYDTDGSTVLVTLTDTYTYSGVFETNRTRTYV